MPRKSLLQSRSHGVTPSSQVQVRLRQGTAVVVVVEEVIVVVVVLSQTVPAPHTPEQQSKPERQPWSPSGIQPTHMPVVVSQSDMAQVPQLPPQPSSPQFLPAQSGVQTHRPVASHVSGAVQVPHEPPQPSPPHSFPAQFGTHWHMPLTPDWFDAQTVPHVPQWLRSVARFTHVERLRVGHGALYLRGRDSRT